MKNKIIFICAMFTVFMFTFGCKVMDTISIYTITYQSEQGDIPSNKEVEEDYILTIDDLPTLTADGYTFKRWDKTVGDKITEDTTITAIWEKAPAKTPEDDSSKAPAKDSGNDPANDPTTPPEPIMYTITYSTEKGTAPESKKVEEGYVLTAEDLPTNLTDTYYDFVSWNKAVGDKITADTTITASWNLRSCTIYYASFYGTNPAPITKDAGYKLTAADLPFLEKDIENGKLFIGWNKEVGYEITKDTVINADWQDVVFLDLSKIDELGFTNGEIKSIRFQTEAYNGTDGVSFGTNNCYTAYVTADKEMIISGNGNTIYINNTGFNGWNAFVFFRACESISFGGCDTSFLRNMADMFYYMEGETLNLKNVSFAGCDLSNVTSMYHMFDGCKTLVSVDFTGCNTSKVEDMASMFEFCEALTSDGIPELDTSSVESMQNMFRICTSLVNVDLTGFDTSNVKDFTKMFAGCLALKTVDLSSFDTKSVTDLHCMFDGCTSLETIDISSFDTQNVTNVDCMFRSCQNVTTIYASESFDVSSILDPDQWMFETCGSLVGGNGTQYCDRGVSDIPYAHIDVEGNPGYFTAK